MGFRNAYLAAVGHLRTFTLGRRPAPVCGHWLRREWPPVKEGHPQSIRCTKQYLKRCLGLRLALDADRRRRGLTDRIGDQAGTTAEGGEVALHERLRAALVAVLLATWLDAQHQ